MHTQGNARGNQRRSQQSQRNIMPTRDPCHQVLGRSTPGRHSADRNPSVVCECVCVVVMVVVVMGFVREGGRGRGRREEEGREGGRGRRRGRVKQGTSKSTSTGPTEVHAASSIQQSCHEHKCPHQGYHLGQNNYSFDALQAYCFGINIKL